MAKRMKRTVVLRGGHLGVSYDLYLYIRGSYVGQLRAGGHWLQPGKYEVLFDTYDPALPSETLYPDGRSRWRLSRTGQSLCGMVMRTLRLRDKLEHRPYVLSFRRVEW